MPKRTKNPRMCVFCRKKDVPSAFLRIVRLPDGSVVWDKDGCLNGRGAYICPSLACLKGAIKSGALGRALKASIPDDVYDDLVKFVGVKDGL
ncbi:MAG: YlxR family protein [Synergistales bacterium]|nr:YlxR family protein [Synergistales bacterium]